MKCDAVHTVIVNRNVMKLQVVTNRKLYLQIADQIREQISSGVVKPGQQLPSERDLALALGVSRPTVREALIALEVAGLLEVRIGVGAFVKSQDDQANLPDISHSPIEVMAVRRLLEPEAAALAAQHIADAGRQRLVTTVEAMRKETARDEWSADNDRTFHMTIAEASGNQVLREFLAQLWAARSERLDRQFHAHVADMPPVRKHIITDHEAICTAILKGDAKAAHTAMASHLEYVENAMLSVWD